MICHHRGNKRYGGRARGVRKKACGALVGCFLLVPFVSGCRPNATVAQHHSENQVTVAISKTDEPEYGLDPTYGWGHGASPLVQSTLLRYDRQQRIMNDAALRYEVSDDGLDWRFRLRDDIKFTDGTPLEAADVVFTFEQAKEHRTFVDLSVMESATAVDSFNVVIRLREPSLPFLHTVTMLGIVPEHAYSGDYAADPIGSGPYVLKEWQRGEHMILERNGKYYGQKPAIGKAVLLFMDEEAAFVASESGQVDVALTSAAFVRGGRRQQAASGMRLMDIPTTDNRGMTLPLEPVKQKRTATGFLIGNDVTSDPAIRQALAYGIDRQQLVSDALGGYGTAAFSENDGLPWNNPEVQIPTDLSRARKILKDSGWFLGPDGIAVKGGRKAEFSCLYASGDILRQAIALDTAQQALKLGIKINVQGVGWPEIRTRMFSDAVLMGWGSLDPSLSIILFHGSNKWHDDYYNPEGFDDPAVNFYLDQARKAKTTEKMYELLKKAQWDGRTGDSMRGIVPWLWLVNVHHLYYVKEGLSIGEQPIHGHGASWSLIANLEQWSWS